MHTTPQKQQKEFEDLNPRLREVTPQTAIAVKHDQNKEDLSLLSTIWVMGVAKVLTFGKIKYAAHNWRKGFALSRVLAAALRHIFQFLGGQDLDSESGLCHLDHASCMLMFARELWETRQDLDDRYKAEKKNEVQPNLGQNETLKCLEDMVSKGHLSSIAFDKICKHLNISY